MKFTFIKTILPLLYLLSASTLFYSCSENETKINPTAGLVKITEGYALGAGAKVELWAREELFAGYNQLYFVLYDSTTGNRIHDSHIHLNPVMNMHTMSHSCPVEEPESEAVNELFPSAIMFTMPSGDMGSWSLEVKIHNHLNGLFGKALLSINVKNTTSSRVTSFQTGTGAKYYLSYFFPEKMKVGVNDFEVIVYTITEGNFIPVENLTINFTPTMPSMDHGSPNNQDPQHFAKGHYKGKANFTMTGDWRLNLELIDENESVIGEKYFDILVN